MRNFWSVLLIVALGVVSGCDSSSPSKPAVSSENQVSAKSEQTANLDAPVASVPALVYAPDVHSFAKPNDARVSDIKLDFEVDFKAKQLRGTALLTVVRKPFISELWLDTRDWMCVALSL